VALPFFSWLGRSAKSALGYDAVENRGKRREATGVLRSEEQELPGTSRRKLVSQARDVHRNFTIAAWMIRRHLDYVTSFRFQSRSGDPDLDNRVEDLMRRQTERERCDIAHRHPFDRMVRLAEARRCVDGDVGLLKLNTSHLQAIEGDRIRSLGGSAASAAYGPWGGAVQWFDYGHGVVINTAGRALGYSVCSRVFGGGFRFERVVPARNLYLHAFWDRFDQVRGVSPIAAGLNSLCDVYEGVDYALAKAKIAQLFALAITRKSDQGMGEQGTSAEEQEDGKPRYTVDFGKGPVKLELDDGDTAEFLANDTPGPGFQEFLDAVIGIALKALDIPFSFYDESFTNYSGARQALLQYEEAAKHKRRDVRAMIDHVTRWWMRRWELEGRLPKSIRAKDLRWTWAHSGLPWLDPLNEIQANIAAIGAGLDSRTNILAQQGRTLVEVADELALETEYLARKGLPTDVQAIHALIPKVASGDPQPSTKQARRWAAMRRKVAA